MVRWIWKYSIDHMVYRKKKRKRKKKINIREKEKNKYKRERKRKKMFYGRKYDSAGI